MIITYARKDLPQKPSILCRPDSKRRLLYGKNFLLPNAKHPALIAGLAEWREKHGRI